MPRWTLLIAVCWPAAVMASPTAPSRSGRELYEAACASCHGSDGRGEAAAQASFPLTPPDLTDCNFATREPDNDWMAVGHNGGPARGFSPLMPSFAELLTTDELQRVITHIRGFCTDDAWPRGELNLPRAQVTSKAYPEDEAALRVIAAEDELTTRFVYARRFGARTQLEAVVPLVLIDEGEGEWTSGAGDVSIGVKHVLLHSLRLGGILSGAAEVSLPTGRVERGIGSGTTVFEGFLAYGQLLAPRTFVQLQLGGGVPWDRDHADELFGRAVVGHRFLEGRGYGRAWSPMVEVLVARELVEDAVTHVDLLPQLQVTLSARQHVVASAGVRIPVNDRDTRSTQVVLYLIWDWFDGGFLTGW